MRSHKQEVNDVNKKEKQELVILKLSKLVPITAKNDFFSHQESVKVNYNRNNLKEYNC